MRAHDRQTVMALRHALQTCESSKRQAWRALGTFQEHLIAACEKVPIVTTAKLAGEISAIRLLLAGAGEGVGRC